MKNDRWGQISELFQSALKLDPQARPLYLEQKCGDDSLLDQVNSLLRAYENAESEGFIDAPAVRRAARAISEQKPLEGEIAGRYKVISRLGAGGMGEVYLADDMTLKRQVALKVLLAETLQDRDRIRRFVQEARAASALNHPNILTIYEVGDVEGSRFIVTEYIRGETLRDRLAHGPLTVPESVDIGCQVAAALDAAHDAGIVHRDIKPENVMIRGDGLVKVLDFGLAKLSDSTADTLEFRPTASEAETRDVFQTLAGTIMGTAAYMSPEQARGQRVDARSDIWSLGALIFEMIAGRQPFGGDTVSDTIAAILKTNAPRLRDAPEQLADIVAKALQKDIYQRYQHVSEVMLNLRELKQDLEFAARLEKSRPSLDSAFVNSPGVEQPRRVLAVMPFVNASGNTEYDYLSDGITDSLINTLSQLPNVTMKARSSVFQYKGKEVSPQTIGSELSVQAALFGRITRLGDRLNFNLELVDTQTGDRIWGELYDREQAQLQSLQGEITRDVANKLGVRLSSSGGHRAQRPDTSNPEAYKFFLQALYLLNKRTADDIRKSIELFKRATERDPQYAKAFVGLASAYTTLRPYNQGLSRQEVKDLADKARAAINRARELDDSLPEVHAHLGLSYDVEWKFAEGEKEYLRALQMNPNDATVRSAYSLNLSFRGRHAEAIEQINTAYELDPFSRTIPFNVGARLAEARRFDEAIAQYHRVLELEPDHPLTHLVMAQALEAKGLYAEAVPEHRTANVLLKKESAEAAERKAADLMSALQTGGETAYWSKRLEISKTEYEQGHGLAYRVAIAYARLAETNRAFEQLEISYADHELFLPWLGTEPAFDPMRGDPRFGDLMKRMGLLD